MAQTEKETIVGPGTQISGELRGEENLLVRGRVEGKIQISETLTIDVGAVVQADVDVRHLVVSGILIGSITASESVHLTDKARVVGDLSAPRVIIDAGAAYRGRVEMGDVSAEVPAVKRTAAERPTTAHTETRLAPPARTVAPQSRSLPATTLRPPTAPPRVSTAVAAPARPAPSLPRPEGPVGGTAATPGWAKKKVRRR